jgi:hypothetical protein
MTNKKTQKNSYKKLPKYSYGKDRFVPDTSGNDPNSLDGLESYRDNTIVNNDILSSDAVKPALDMSAYKTPTGTNWAGVAGMGATLAGGIVDNATQKTTTDAFGTEYKTQSIGGGAAANALKGAGMGSSFGPVGAAVGAGLGAIYGGITANMNNNMVDKAKAESVHRLTDIRTNQATNKLTNLKSQGFNSQGNSYSSIYRKGGYITYADGGKIKLKTEPQRLPSDNTSSYTATHKNIKPENRPREPINEIISQTLLDQVNVGKTYNGLEEIPKKYNTSTGKTINLGLEYIKTKTPIVGDLIANTLQTGVEIVDSKYAQGGNVEPQYEVEGNEVVQGNDTQLEGSQELASDMTKAIGPSHDNGGVKGAGGERVFSDRLYASPLLHSYLSANKVKVSKGATYAEIAEKLGKKKGKYEIKADSHNPLTHNTGKAMTTRMDELIEATFQEQEMSKGPETNTTQFALGGDIFSNPDEFKDKLPDNSPVRVGNDKEYVARPTAPYSTPSPVKQAMITNPTKAQNFKPLAKDAAIVHAEKKKNPAWKNFDGNYSIYSKENSTLNLFDNKHNLIDQTRAGRGKDAGDIPNTAHPDSNGKWVGTKTTPAGNYAIQEIKSESRTKDYGTPTYNFGPINEDGTQVAAHGTYKGEYYTRTKVITDPKVKQAFVSNGCLNVPPDWLNKNDKNFNTGDSLFITKEPTMKKFKTGGNINSGDDPAPIYRDVRKLRKMNPTWSGSDGDLMRLAGKEFNTSEEDYSKDKPLLAADVNSPKHSMYQGVPFNSYTSPAKPKLNIIEPDITNDVNKLTEGIYSKMKSTPSSNPVVNTPGVTASNTNTTATTNSKFKIPSFDNVDGGQVVNAGVYLSNLKNANKQKTNIKRQVATPTYMRNVNMLPYNKMNISKEARTAGTAVDRMSGNVQDSFGRKAAINVNAMEAINNASMNQAGLDMQTNNQNTAIQNDYNNRLINAGNEDALDKLQGENAILTNKQNATNTFLQGVMGNMASNRQYAVDKERISIARMDAGRGTVGRSDAELEWIKKYMVDGQLPKRAKGGYVKSKRKVGYC